MMASRRSAENARPAWRRRGSNPSVFEQEQSKAERLRSHDTACVAGRAILYTAFTGYQASHVFLVPRTG